MAKPTAAWGIDIGQCALKALRLEIIDGVPTATAFDYIEHPKILSQPDADPDALTREALDKFLSRNQLKNDIIGIGIPGQSGLARFVKLPPVEESKIGDIVKFEAKQQIPFPLEEVVWDFQKISGGEVIGGFAMETEVGLFAMKREVISKYMGQYNAAGIECHVVQMAPLALTNFATYELLKKGGTAAAVDPEAPVPEDDTPRGKKRCAVVLDVGTDSSNLIITDAGKIIWQRPLPLGGNHFTRALTKEMKLTFAKAEHLKRNAAKSPDLAQILKGLRPVLTDFVGEVQRSLGYFTNTHRDAHVAYMVGLGSAFKLPGLQKYMSEKLSLDVRKPNKIERLQGDAVLKDPVFAENLLTFPVAYGLALQGLNQLGDVKDYGRINTNLLPTEIRTERLIRAKKPYAAAAAACLLLGTGAMAFGYGVQYNAVSDPSIKREAEKAKTIVDAATKQSKEKDTGEKAIDDSQTDVKAIIRGNPNRLDVVRLHEVISAALPRAGEDGNLFDKADGTMRTPFWSSEEGRRALLAAKLRVKQGVPIDRAGEEDLSSNLAQVNIEMIHTRYTDNLKSFYEKADASTWSRFSRAIAEKMPEAEREKDENEQKAWKPKLAEGGGWVVEVRGYTNHSDGTKFLENAVLGNFKDADLYATQTKGEKVGKYLTGVTDPISGRISHVSLLYTKQIENPKSKKADFTGQGASSIDKVIDAVTSVTPGTEGTQTPPPSGDTGTVGSGTSSGGGWVPLGGSTATGGGSGGIGGTGMEMSGMNSGTGPDDSGGGDRAMMIGPMGPMGPMGPGPVGAAPADPVKPAKPKFRYEFVICFAWRDAAGQTVPQTGTGANLGGGGNGGGAGPGGKFTEMGK